MRRSYYSQALTDFCEESDDSILGVLASSAPKDVTGTQRDAWMEQIRILKQLKDLKSGHLILEYVVPRMGKRVDTVFIYSDFIFVMEFKVRKDIHTQQDAIQCIDYALDLKNFHEESHCASIVPVLISTDAPTRKNEIVRCKDGVYDIIRANKNDTDAIIKQVCTNSPDSTIKTTEWENSSYRPTPTILEAALALCKERDNIDFMTRSDAGAQNLGKTTDAIDLIISESKQNNRKSICFVTGVPGSGKTLAGLNIVCEKQSVQHGRAVFLTGNGPLVKVLKETLVRNKDMTNKYGRGVDVLVQHIRDFVTHAAHHNTPPDERILVFDEAQRAWTADKLAVKMKDSSKSQISGMSQPEIVLHAMDKHSDWAVVVCLVGNGQEIHTGEAGLSEWFHAIEKSYPHWNVYIPNRTNDIKRIDGDAFVSITHDNRVKKLDYLHLETSIRSFRADNVSKLINEILDCDADSARATFSHMKDKYPILITRNLDKAKKWIRDRRRGSERCGMIASSGAKRLKPFGVYVDAKIDPVTWFLNGEKDPRSSYYLELVATEFETQGLELDWTCLAWDGNLRFEDGQWSTYSFRGSRWTSVRKEDAVNYLKNSYRVLMTRARQGMIIFVPHGDKYDDTRRSEFYDGTYKYLKGIGFDEI